MRHIPDSRLQKRKGQSNHTSGHNLAKKSFFLGKGMVIESTAIIFPNPMNFNIGAIYLHLDDHPDHCLSSITLIS